MINFIVLLIFKMEWVSTFYSNKRGQYIILLFEDFAFVFLPAKNFLLDRKDPDDPVEWRKSSDEQLREVQRMVKYFFWKKHWKFDFWNYSSHPINLYFAKNLITC